MKCLKNIYFDSGIFSLVKITEKVFQIKIRAITFNKMEMYESATATALRSEYF